VAKAVLKWLAVGILDAMQPTIPWHVARWVPNFLLASPREKEQLDRLRERFRG
jgi:hypothetical protein